MVEWGADPVCGRVAPETSDGTPVTPTRRSMVAKSTAVIACALLLLCAALVGAGAAGAAKGDYPAKVEKAFMKSCVKSAHSGGDGLSRRKARKYCQTAFELHREQADPQAVREGRRRVQEGPQGDQQLREGGAEDDQLTRA